MDLLSKIHKCTCYDQFLCLGTQGSIGSDYGVDGFSCMPLSTVSLPSKFLFFLHCRELNQGYHA